MSLNPKPANSSKLKTIILAAGFGTRLRQLGKNTAKGLFKNQEELTITDLIIKQIKQLKVVDQIALVTNNHFFKQYQNHLQHNYQPELEKQEIILLNDGANSPETRLGSLGDLAFALDQLDWWNQTILVTPSDRTPTDIIQKVLEGYKQHPEAFIVCLAKDTKENIKNKYGCAKIDQNNQVIEFEEKPAEPQSNYRALPYYIFNPAALKMLRQYQQEDQNMDSPGHIVPWLLKNNFPIFAVISKAKSIDIGDLEQLKKFQRN